MCSQKKPASGSWARRDTDKKCLSAKGARAPAGYVILMDIDGRKQQFDYLPRGGKTPKLADMWRLTVRGQT